MTIYHGPGHYEIDKIQVYTKFGFPARTDIVAGLRGFLRIPVKFDPKVKDFEYYFVLKVGFLQ